MCTVTIIPLVRGGRTIGVRLATNRDESRNRPPAQPPLVHEGRLRFIWPVDPVGGGTWVGVNEAGLFATLLNRHDGSARPVAPAARSRGIIIPALLDAETLPEARGALSRFDASDFMPFTLLAAHGHELLCAASIDGEIRMATQPIDATPLMFTSSGLGDAVVEGPRRRLFDTWFTGPPDQWPTRQDEFQRHYWPQARRLSVCMSRADAMTVSRTVIEVDDERVQLHYHGRPPCEPCEPVTVSLARRRTAN